MGCSTSKASPEKRPEIRGVVKREPDPAVGSVPRVKLVLLGDSGVGKSCLVLRYVRGQFDPSSKVTVGAAFMSHSVHLPEGITVKFEIWDTAGQERYASLAPLYYRGASAAAVVYDITNADSFAKAKYWVAELQKNAPADITIILVGNKVDLEDDRAVPTEEGRTYAEENAMLFIESSAKTAENVPEIFETVARKISGAPMLAPAATVPGS